MSRELDVEVAEKVMGITKIFSPSDYKGSEDCFVCGEDIAYIPSGKSPRTHMIDALAIRRFSSEIAAAMEVVEKLRADGWSFACTLYEGKLPYASFCKGTAKSSRNAEAGALSEAICRAALAAIERKLK